MDEAHVVPILFTDAKTGVGVAELLDAIARHFPSPVEGNPRAVPDRPGAGDRENERPFEYANDPAKPLLAHVFKVTTDPFVGKLAVFRVHQGKAAGNTQVFIGHNKKPVKLGHVFHLQGKEHKEADAIIAGDIGAVAKIEEIHTGDVLHDDHALDSVHLKPLTFPTPMYGLAVTPKARGDEQKISGVLAKMAEEDPTFKWHTDRQTHEMVINGIGELHLRLVLEKLKNRGLHVDTKPPKIAYRETITPTPRATTATRSRPAARASSARSSCASSRWRQPAQANGGFEFVNEIFGGTIPGQFIPAVEKGVRELLDAGRHRRLPAAGRQGRRLRRQAPPGGQQGSRLQDRRQVRLQGRVPQGQARAARADRQHGSDRPRGTTSAPSPATSPASAAESRAPTSSPAAWPR